MKRFLLALLLLSTTCFGQVWHVGGVTIGQENYLNWLISDDSVVPLLRVDATDTVILRAAEASGIIQFSAFGSDTPLMSFDTTSGSMTLADALTVSGTLFTAAKIEHTGDPDTYFEFVSNTFRFVTDGVRGLTLAAGNVIVSALDGEDTNFLVKNNDTPALTIFSVDTGTDDTTVSVGDLIIVNGTLTASDDTDSTHILGRVTLSSPFADFAVFSHVDHATTTGFGLRQSSLGYTSINAPSGQSIGFNINNTEIAHVDSSGLNATGLDWLGTDITGTTIDADSGINFHFVGGSKETITDISNGVDGQTIRITMATTNDCWFDDGPGNIKNPAGATIELEDIGDSVVYHKNGSDWYLVAEYNVW